MSHTRPLALQPVSRSRRIGINRGQMLQRSAAPLPDDASARRCVTDDRVRCAIGRVAQPHVGTRRQVRRVRVLSNRLVTDLSAVSTLVLGVKFEHQSNDLVFSCKSSRSWRGTRWRASVRGTASEPRVKNAITKLDSNRDLNRPISRSS